MYLVHDVLLVMSQTQNNHRIMNKKCPIVFPDLYFMRRNVFEGTRMNNLGLY